MSIPEFCDQHGNLKENCHMCNPEKKVVTIITGITCPVYSQILRDAIPDDICNNPGCIMTNITSRTETYQCTGCGWEFTNHRSNNPYWVICDCGNSELRQGQYEKCSQCSYKKRFYRHKCATCTEVWARCTCPGRPENN